ncbi:methyltransferase domain-containing protein [Candidatus Bathyarchaeota archaeon]|nr:methyltransferase domain-containing protein [Candidatus Bathyarchaeota archaeon]
MDVRVSIEVAMSPKTAFANVIDEVTLSLHRLGLEFQPKAGGRIRQGKKELGRILSWSPGKQAEIVWYPLEWDPKTQSRLRLDFQPTKRGTRVTLGHRGLERIIGMDGGEQLGWFSTQLAVPFLNSLTPSGLGDWITDRRARRPSGAGSRKTYRNPTFHIPNFKAILAKLSLSPEDRLLEIGCGGGVLLKEALMSGCRAAGVDHSPEMVRLATKKNAKAVKEGRLEIRETEADSLPFEDARFTCAVMTSILGFLPDPVKVFREVRRVLKPGGRMIVFSTSKEAKGTPAAPEPIASRVHFYEDNEIEQMALQAGFHTAHVERPDLSEYARGIVPKQAQDAFSNPFGQLLMAHTG